jgi:hypothetical protein
MVIPTAIINWADADIPPKSKSGKK